MNKPLLAATLSLVAASHLLAPVTVVAAPAGTASATYNPNNGTMEIDVGTGLGVVGVESIGNVILGRTYSPTPQMMDQNVIAYFNPAGFSFDFILLNNAFKTGLTANDFVFTYVPIGGVEVFSPVEIVPEPGALALLATSGMGVAALRRRRCLRRCCDP